MPRIALYAGSFDPPTLGHVDIIRRGLAIADGLVIAVGTHPGKAPLFSFEERQTLLEAVARPFAVKKPLTITRFDDLTVSAARRLGASILLRGLRDGTDLDYEMQLSGMNGTLAPEIETVFLPASPAFRPMTATLVRQIAAMGGDVSAFVPEAVKAALTLKFARP